MKITEFIKNNILLLDGGMGTMLQKSGLMAGELPEMWSLSHPEVIRDIHKSYYEAGSNLVLTNTFGANRLKLDSKTLEEVIEKSVSLAKWAKENSSGEEHKWIGLDIGPTGRMLKPLGDLDFEEAVDIFSESISIGAKCGADIIFIETMSDSYETKAALLAAKESCDLPVFVSNAYGADGKLMTGASPSAMVAMLEGMGAEVIGANCSLGPSGLVPVAKEYIKYSSTPLMLKPNAGLPTVVEGETFYSLSPKDFASELCDMAKMGVSILGGCCGTTPEYIRELRRAVKDLKPASINKKHYTLTSSYTHAVEIGGDVVLIGERINPTGKPRFKEALRLGDMDHILREAVMEEESGAQVLDVNVGLPEINEAELLAKTVKAIQEISTLPLQIDSANPLAMEQALRVYNGKAMINSVNGKEESMKAVFPLVKKYGGVVVALTLDEGGIPKTAEGRVDIAKKILSRAESYGIDKDDIIFDPLAMSVSADRDAARETLRAVKMISQDLGCHTSLGVSNVSFGLPKRELINSAFLSLALANGLSAAIINPHSDEIMTQVRSYRALMGYDENFASFISSVEETKEETLCDVSDIKWAIIKGMKARASELCRASLADRDPMDILNKEIIPALNEVGDGFEKKKIYLPSLLMSAEAAGACAEVIKSALPKGESSASGKIILATVKGDIHDIGKNIVKLLLENYGYDVVDLGKDVSAEIICDETINLSADIVGLSALMTTTACEMERTIKLLRERGARCKIMVGGAVITEDYAKQIGADFYGKDGMDAVKYASEVIK